MIPNLKTLPVASGHENNVSNSSQPHEKSGLGEDKKAFGDILNSQESQASAVVKDKNESNRAVEDGNKYPSNGKELPAEAKKKPLSSTASEEAAPAKENIAEPFLAAGVISPENPVLSGKLVPADINQTNEPELLLPTNPEAESAQQFGNQLESQPKPEITDLVVKGTVDTVVSREVTNSEVTNAGVTEAALKKETGLPTVTDDLNRTAGVPQSLTQRLNGNNKQPESNIFSHNNVTPVTTDEVTAGTKPMPQPDLVSAQSHPVTVNAKSPATSGVVHHTVSADVTKHDINALQSGSLIADDFDALQQSVGSHIAKEKAIFESLEQLAKLDSPSAKSIAPTQVTSSVPTSLVSPVANNSTSPILGSGVESVLRSGAGTMTSSIGDPAWDSEFLGRVNVLVKGGIHEAKIQLSPPEMGRLEIKVSTEGDSAKIMFSVDNVAARDAIEQAMPRLREMLEQGGIQLSHSEVADYSQSQKGNQQVDEGLVSTGMPSESDQEEEDVGTWQLGASPSNSTVDYYI